MRKLSTVIKEAQSNPLPQGMSYVSRDQLEKYLEAASRIISSDAKLIIAYLIEQGAATDETLLDIARNRQSDPRLQEIASAVNKLKKYDRLKEVPVFQTPEEFEAVVNQECTVDEILFDFSTDAGRNAIAKKYEGLVASIANSYRGKTNLTMDELMSAGWNGFTHALNKYANTDRIKTDSDGKKKLVSFGTFAAQQIRFYILEDIKNYSHTVRIPTSAQAKERAETGKNTKTNTVSGDAVKAVNTSKGGNDKTYFDTLADTQADSGGIFSAECDSLWSELIERIREYFNARGRGRDVEVFLDSFGIRRADTMKDKEVAAKYGIAPSNVTRIKKDVIKFIQSDSLCQDLCGDLGSYFNESMTTAPYVHKRTVESSVDSKVYNIVEGRRPKNYKWILA